MSPGRDEARTEVLAPWPIGEPGRAATEVPPGRPVPPAGRADVAVSWAAVGALRVNAAAVRGLMHRSTSEPRQDAFALTERCAADGPGALIAVVCDGVGSLERSHEAADLVSRRLAEAGATGEPWPDAVQRVNEELRAVAVVDDDKVMATTAVAVAVERDGDDWVGEIAWVGDSSCWHLDADGAWSELTATETDDEAPYHSTSVRPLPSSDGACSTSSFRVSGGALFLMTDGVANPLRWGDDVRATLADWWRVAGDPLTFAGQVGFSRKTHIDDRAVVGIWHEPTDEPTDEDEDHENRTVPTGPAD